MRHGQIAAKASSVAFPWSDRVMIAIAVTASLLGVYLSFFLDSAPAPTIVLLLTMVSWRPISCAGD